MTNSKYRWHRIYACDFIMQRSSRLKLILSRCEAFCNKHSIPVTSHIFLPSYSSVMSSYQSQLRSKLPKFYWSRCEAFLDKQLIPVTSHIFMPSYSSVMSSCQGQIVLAKIRSLSWQIATTADIAYMFVTSLCKGN